MLQTLLVARQSPKNWKRRKRRNPDAISRTSRWNGDVRISKSVLFWYFRISLSATVPGRNRCFFFAPCDQKPFCGVFISLCAQLSNHGDEPLPSVQ
jgi:hypothetical protein